MSTEFRVDYSLGTVLKNMLRANGVNPYILTCAFVRPITDNGWTILLPNDITPEMWKNPRFRLVIHGQDFATWYKDFCLELLWIETQFTPEQLEKVIFVHWDHSLQDWYQGPVTCIEFPTHSYELVKTLKNNWSDWKHIPLQKKIKHNWLCLNGRARAYRQDVYNLLKDEPSGFVSHSIFNPVKQLPYNHYNFNNVENFVKIGTVYQEAKTSIITESIYADHPGIITEKTLFAIAAKHPFMCIGHRGIHQEIKQRGFKLYDHLFNLEFDNDSSETRLFNAIDSNLEILRNNIDLENYKDIIEYNFDYLLNDYLNFLENRARQQILDHLVQF